MSRITEVVLMNIPVNRWTVGVVVALLTIYGGDFIAPFMKVIGILSAPYTPAI